MCSKNIKLHKYKANSAIDVIWFDIHEHAYEKKKQYVYV